MKASPGGRVFTAFLVVATCALCVLVVMLTRQNRRLRSDNEQLAQALLREQTRGTLGIGEGVEPLTVFDIDGVERELRFAAGTPTLVLLASSDCPHCTETLPMWDRVLTQTRAARSAGVGVVLIQIDADRPDQLKPAPASLTPLGAKGATTTWLRKIPISPAALWIDGGGVVRKAWHGVPSQRDEHEIASALLGGLDEPKK